MHTHNVNVKTATEESSRKMEEKDIPLTDAQVIETFNWVFAVTADMPEAHCHDFIPPTGAEEIDVFFDDVPDYYTIWILNKWPVAAAMPLDSVFRVLSTHSL
ncbi:hypothetical protein [Kosakonia radicincitans]|uniref:hypothetical protein n=1 Tax=Kosakonia radicincitans TaxID=283686 RepID=UPI000461DCDD|nr:hypothetical protein [Kosakonia radicincitans]KDE33537.1 hypothetical protein AW40_27190 [Kosakonia radicincitans UMEnt01/12]MDD7997473.1 hypothetical protein [Kosakonia radicincitans]